MSTCCFLPIDSKIKIEPWCVFPPPIPRIWLLCNVTMTITIFILIWLFSSLAIKYRECVVFVLFRSCFFLLLLLCVGDEGIGGRITFVVHIRCKRENTIEKIVSFSSVDIHARKYKEWTNEKKNNNSHLVPSMVNNSSTHSRWNT